jgi:arylsulfatase A-like enzyme/Tfp pilus assembly protein PilF
VGVAALAVLAIAWWRPALDSPRYPGGNVLLITIDTLRADRLGAYGYDRAETPRMDKLAAEGIRFEEVVAPAPLTLPSHASLMTSMNPPSHGIRDNAAFEISAGAQMLAELFKESGYETGAFVGAYVLHSRWGLSRGFDTYDDRFDYGEPGALLQRAERRGDKVVETAVDWLKCERDAPFFAWVHFFDPHDPYTAPDPYGGRFAERPYDGEVAYVDLLVGELIDALSRYGESEETIVVVTSDHGEALNDHGEPTHGLFLYDSTVLVPLIIRLPNQKAAGLDVSEQVRLIDVAPTILELVGIATPASFEGKSLLPHLSGEGSARPAYSETFVPRFHFGWQELHAVRSDGYKYILAPRPELYLVNADPGEIENLLESRPTQAEALRAELEEIRGQGGALRPGELSGEARRQLQSLGYIAAPPADLPEGTLADPKDKIDLYRRFNDGLHLLNVGKAADAEEVLEEVVVEDPRLVVAHLSLGNARLTRGDHAGAVEAFKAALELNPEYELALSGLGMSQLGVGDRLGARETFETLLLKEPGHVNARLQLGQMDLEDQNLKTALRHFEAGLATHDSVPALHFGLGVAALQLGDVTRAADALERAAKMAPAYPQVHYYLALVAEARGNVAKAIEEYRAEVKNHTDNYESSFNLSLQLADAGDLNGAIDSLRKTIAAKPDLAIAHLYLGRALLALNDPQRYDEAAEAVRRGLALNPSPELRRLGQAILADINKRR